MIFSLDTETTGVDLHHASRPFFVTICTEDLIQRYWEWDVDPKTRNPLIPPGDLEEIADLIQSADRIVLQNAKFDVAALGTVAPGIAKDWPWEKTEDTLILGHLLASNLPHNLTDMGVQYLGVDILPYETALNEACDTARRFCRSKLPGWKIAKAGLPGMPSAKEKTWKSDTWLLRAVWKEMRRRRNRDYPEDHPWTYLLRDYANADSAVTITLWKAQMEEVRRRGLEAIYRERMKVIPVAYAMESRGLTLNGERLDCLTRQYIGESERAGRICTNIAAGLGHELVLPKNGVNGSLRDFCFEVLDLPRVRNPKAKTDEPTLNKEAMNHFLAVLPERSKALTFIRQLLKKRQRDTAIAYMDGYRRFQQPLYDDRGYALPDWFVLHPNLNPTGTDTLRWSSSNPNEQNISKQEAKCKLCEGKAPDVYSCEACETTGIEFRSLRYCFGPGPGREWWSLDAKNIELRLPAYESGEKAIIELFERPDDPPYYGSTHLLNFHTVYPDLWEKELREVGEAKVGPYCKKRYATTYYQWCKNGGFAVQYGAVDKADGTGTADRAFHRPGSHARLKARFANLEALNRKCILFAEKHGYIETIPDLTVDPKRGYPVMCTRTEWGKILPTVPLNYHIQSTAMWWMMKAMIRVYSFFQDLNRGKLFKGKRWPGGYYLALQVHDELVPDMPSGRPYVGKRVGEDGSTLIKEPWEYNLPIVREVRRLMELGGKDMGIPTPTSCEFHEHNWSEGVSVE